MKSLNLNSIKKGILKVSALKIAAQRPHYLPDFFYFYKIFYSDKFLISDFLGFRKQSPIVRADFGDILLTIPVQHQKSNPHPPITKVKMLDQKFWRNKHLKTLTSRFSSLPFFEHYYQELVNIFLQDGKVLNQFLLDIILWQLHLVLPGKDVQICSRTGIMNLQDLRIWLGQFADFQWITYPNETFYYRNHFPKAKLVELPKVGSQTFPPSYRPSMPLLVLFFLLGPETIMYFS